MAKRRTKQRSVEGTAVGTGDLQSNPWVELRVEDFTPKKGLNTGQAGKNNNHKIKVEPLAKERTNADSADVPLEETSKKPSLIVKLPVVQPFPFMRLPLEIRTMVYKELLIQVGPVEFFGRYSRRGVVFKPSIDRKRKDEDEDHDGDHSDEDGFHTVTTLHYKDRISQSFVPRLFRTSKTVYSEAATIYFRYNDFKFNGLDNVAPFINGLPAISRRAITSVSIEYTGIGPALAAKALNTCVGLQYLHLHFRESSTFLIPFKMGRRQDMKGWQALNGLTSFLKLRGLAELRVTKSKSNSFSWRFDDDWHAFVEALQVLKQPPNGRHLTIQGNKDFPKQAVREVFGNTNFVTRAERRFTGRKLYRIPLPGECPESERELFANS